MHGKGAYKWPDGRTYTGNYIGDKREGMGEYVWPDGRKYNGEWS